MLRNVGDQPIQSVHIVADDREHRPATRVLTRLAVDRRSERGEGVFLVRDIGGERLGRVDPARSVCLMRR